MERGLYDSGKRGGFGRAMPWVYGVAVSVALFYAVIISGKPPEELPEKEAPMVAESVVLAPPPPIDREPPPQPRKPTTPRKIEFERQHSEEAVTLLDVKIEPEKEQDLLSKISLDLSEFSVTMDDVNEFFVFEKSEVDKTPTALHQPFPQVPRKIKIEKFVKVRIMFYVDEVGRVENAYIVESQMPELNKIVLDAVREWRFKPAEKGGRKVRCWIRTAIHFNANNSSPFSI